MATIIVPLATAVAPAVIELVAKFVDKIIGSKNGPIKHTVSTAIVQTLGQGLSQVGQMTTPPDANQTGADVQRIVDALNARGELKGPATVLTPADTIDKGDLRRILTIVEAIAPGLGVK